MKREKKKYVEPAVEKREQLKEVTGMAGGPSAVPKGGCFKPEKKD